MRFPTPFFPPSGAFTVFRRRWRKELGIGDRLSDSRAVAVRVSSDPTARESDASMWICSNGDGRFVSGRASPRVPSAILQDSRFEVFFMRGRMARHEGSAASHETTRGGAAGEGIVCALTSLGPLPSRFTQAWSLTVPDFCRADDGVASASSRSPRDRVGYAFRPTLRRCEGGRGRVVWPLCVCGRTARPAPTEHERSEPFAGELMVWSLIFARRFPLSRIGARGSSVQAPVRDSGGAEFHGRSGSPPPDTIRFRRSISESSMRFSEGVPGGIARLTMERSDFL